MFIRFDENDIRYMGRIVMGVKGIILSKEDFVVFMNFCSKGIDVLVVSKNGFGKRINIEEYRS